MCRQAEEAGFESLWISDAKLAGRLGTGFAAFRAAAGGDDKVLPRLRELA